MNKTQKWLIAITAFIAAVAVGIAWFLTRPGTTEATPTPTVIVTQTMTAKPSAPTTTAPTQAPSTSNPTSAEPSSVEPTKSVPTTGPESDTPITVVCLGVPSNLHYLGQCKVASVPKLTGRQAFQACTRTAQHVMALVSDGAHGVLHYKTVEKDTHLCVASIGMSDYGIVSGYPNGKTGVKFMVLSDDKNHVLAFDGTTGLLLRGDGSTYMDKIQAWEASYGGGGD